MALVQQQGESLGERLDNLLTAAFANGATQAVVMDSDSPTLPPHYVAQAFAELEGPNDVVLGPCLDGGYYLIGMKQPHPRLLREVTMSTTNVLRDTLALAEALGVRVALLPPWYDVDTATELSTLQAELATAPSTVAVHTRRLLAGRAWA